MIYYINGFELLNYITIWQQKRQRNVGSPVRPLRRNPSLRDQRERDGSDRKAWIRIRKLTPKECFRLMDVSDEDIEKLLNSGVSNSQLYKLAGNSIVVSCMTKIFSQLWGKKGE